LYHIDEILTKQKTPCRKRIGVPFCLNIPWICPCRLEVCMESSLMPHLFQALSKRRARILINLIRSWMNWVPCSHLMGLIIMEQRSFIVDFLALRWSVRFSLDLFITSVLGIWSQINSRWALCCLFYIWHAGLWSISSYTHYPLA